MTYHSPGSDSPTPDWLTLVLREAGVLRSGSVIRVEQIATGAFNSNTLRLLVEYSGDSEPDAPSHLILKRNISAQWAVEAGLIEVEFYRNVISLPDHPPVAVPCYAAEVDPQSHASYLLLEDLSATHAPPVTREEQISVVNAVPPDRYIDSVVDTLAALHAYWWDHPLIATGSWDTGYWMRDATRFDAYRARRTAAWQTLIAEEGEWFPAELRVLYESVLARLPDYWRTYMAPRFDPPRQITLIHGDAYFCNFLCPRSPTEGETYLIDWQSYGFEIGTLDLANLCATFWTQEQRRQDNREECILRRYHRQLEAGGVTGYSWEDLLQDYRHALIFWLLVPVQDKASGSSKEYWWPKMQCLVAAYRDWHCDGLVVRGQ